MRKLGDVMTSSRLRFSCGQTHFAWAFVAEPRLQALLTRSRRRRGHRIPRRCLSLGAYRGGSLHGSWAAKGPSGRRDVTRDIARRFGRRCNRRRLVHGDPPASSWAPCMAIRPPLRSSREAIVSRDAAVCFQRRLRERFFPSKRQHRAPPGANGGRRRVRCLRPRCKKPDVAPPPTTIMASRASIK